MQSNKTTGRRIREHRTNLKLSPERVGDLIGVSGLHLKTAGAIADSMGTRVTDIWPTPTSPPRRKPTPAAAAPRRTMVAV
jgi:hypothetical protein